LIVRDCGGIRGWHVDRSASDPDSDPVQPNPNLVRPKIQPHPTPFTARWTVQVRNHLTWILSDLDFVQLPLNSTRILSDLKLDLTDLNLLVNFVNLFHERRREKEGVYFQSHPIKSNPDSNLVQLIQPRLCVKVANS
jgi:hypothetical protein